MPGSQKSRSCKMTKKNQAKKLKIALPKGSLQQTTFELFSRAGWRITTGTRELFPSIDDPEIEATLLRAQEIASYVEKGIFDCGITGKDWVIEQSAKVKEVCALTYAKTGFRPVRWVVAVPEDSPIKTPKQLQGKRIATEAVNLTKKYLKEKGIKAEVEFSWGATEAKAHLVDAIVEVTETGSSLRANNLRTLDTVLWSEPVLIANQAVWKSNSWKKEKIQVLAMMLQGALQAYNQVGLKMNVPKKSLDKVLNLLPALQTPTLAPLANSDWFSLEVVVEEKEVRRLIPLLKKAGASGIIEYPLIKLIY